MARPVFIATYNTSTTRGKISNIDNLARLQKCLKGDARKKVQSLFVDPESVPEIVDTLTRSYGQPRLVIEHALHDLRQQPKIKQDDLQSIIDFAEVVKNTCAIIKMTSQPYHLQSPSLIQEVVDKLPTALQLKWAKRGDMYDIPNLEVMSDWLTERANYALKVIPIRLDGRPKRLNEYNLDSNRKPQTNMQRKTFAHNAHIETKPTASNEGPIDEYYKCKMCKGASHELSVCKQFLDLSLNQKWEFVKENRLCKRCLKPHHFLRCKSKT